MSLLENIATAAKKPRLISAYLHWTALKLLSPNPPRRRLRSEILVSGFSGFSEFVAVDDFLTDEEFRFFQSLGELEGDIIDIGANIGVLSLLLARRIRSERVFAVEPNRHTFKSLVQNIALNDASNITPVQCAISDYEGTVKFLSDPVSRGTASIAPDGNEGIARNVESVACTTLDRFVEEHGVSRIAILKVDVEGFETLVFRGGAKTLRDLRPKVIYFEVFPEGAKRAGFAPEAAAEELQKFGYKLEKLTSDGGRDHVDIAEIETLRYANWIATSV